MLAQDRLIPPSHEAVVERVCQDSVNATQPDRFADQGMLQTGLGSNHDQVGDAVAACSIQFVELPNDRSLARVDVDLSGGDVVDVSGRGFGGEAPLLDLLEHALGDFFGEVVDVIPGKDDLDVESELL